jgi:hypothetical protein
VDASDAVISAARVGAIPANATVASTDFHTRTPWGRMNRAALVPQHKLRLGTFAVQHLQKQIKLAEPNNVDQKKYSSATPFRVVYA